MTIVQVSTDIAQARARNRRVGIDPRELSTDPLVQFGRWREEWIASRPLDASAAILATASASHGPSARCVRLSRVDHGFVFFTDLHSQKARDLDAEPRAGLCFAWLELARQVRVSGRVERLSNADNRGAFAELPRPLQLLAWACDQTSVVADHQALKARLQRVEAQFAPGAEVPHCSHWSGFRLVPDTLELWQARSDELHDRFRYRRIPETNAFQIEQVTP